jgi:hypothetical protein
VVVGFPAVPILCLNRLHFGWSTKGPGPCTKSMTLRILQLRYCKPGQDQVFLRT